MYYEKDTIAAIATPYAQGGIGIIRISGANAKNIAQRVFKPAKLNTKISELSGYSGVFGYVTFENQIIDEAILLNFNNPKSYTGEDVVELSVHSGLFILKKVLRAVLSSGARLAEPGEFTKRAFLNGKITLTQAEAVSDLISANSKQAHYAALQLKQGSLFNASQEISNKLTKVISYISAFIDFPEEEITTIEYEKLINSISKIYEKLNFLLQTYDTGKIIKEGISAVIVGKPNVGKSTIMNMLSGHKCSIVTSVAGTTRDLIEEAIMVDDITLKIADTAGIHKTDDVIEKIGISLSLERLQNSQLIFAIFDASRLLEDDDYELIDKVTGKNVIAIINKADLPHKIDVNFIKSKIKTVIIGSAQSNELLKEISEAIKKTMKISTNCSCILANERQYNCIKRATDYLIEAINLIHQNQTLDIISLILEDALNSLFELTGQKVSDTVIDEIFSKFCVGK